MLIGVGGSWAGRKQPHKSSVRMTWQADIAHPNLTSGIAGPDGIGVHTV